MSQGFDSTFPAYHGQVTSAQFRTNMAAIYTQNKGASTPTDLQDGMVWLDTSDAGNHRLKFYRSAGHDWLTILSELQGKGLLNIPVNHYTHTQAVASATWTITHNLGKYPSVVLVNASRVQISHTSLTYTNLNTVTVTFSGSRDGYAYLT